MDASKLKTKPAQLQHWLWKQREDVRAIVRAPLDALRILYLIVKDLAEGQLSLRAMSLVYTTIISLVPLLAISFSVLKGFGAHNEIRPMVAGALEPLGENSAEITDRIIGFVDNIQVGVLGAVGLALLIYSVVSMMQKIERSMNYIWHVQQERTLGQRFNDYLSILMVGPLMLFLSAGMTTSAHMESVNHIVTALPGGEYLLALIGFVIPYIMMALGFAFIYFHMPNTKVKVSAAFIGGLVTAVVWKLLGWGFAEFVASSGSKTAVYSAFASLIIFMVWVYMAWLVLLIGASVAFYVQHPFSSPYIRNHHIDLSTALKEELGLDMLLRIHERFKTGDVGYSATELVKLTGMPHEIIGRIAGHLEDAGLLALSTQKRQPPVYLPAKAPHTTTIIEVLDALRHGGDVDETSNRMTKKTKALLSSRQQATEKLFEGKTIKDLLEANA